MDSGSWLIAGVVLGMILMAFLAIGTYQRGYDEGVRMRRPWRAELAARRQAVLNMHSRLRPAAVAYQRETVSLPEALPAARAG